MGSEQHSGFDGQGVVLDLTASAYDLISFDLSVLECNQTIGCVRDAFRKEASEAVLPVYLLTGDLQSGLPFVENSSYLLVPISDLDTLIALLPPCVVKEALRRGLPFYKRRRIPYSYSVQVAVPRAQIEVLSMPHREGGQSPSGLDLSAFLSRKGVVDVEPAIGPSHEDLPCWGCSYRSLDLGACVPFPKYVAVLGIQSIDPMVGGGYKHVRGVGYRRCLDTSSKAKFVQKLTVRGGEGIQVPSTVTDEKAMLEEQWGSPDVGFGVEGP